MELFELRDGLKFRVAPLPHLPRNSLLGAGFEKNGPQNPDVKELRYQNLESNGVSAVRCEADPTVTASVMIARIFGIGKVGCHRVGVDILGWWRGVKATARSYSYLRPLLAMNTRNGHRDVATRRTDEWQDRQFVLAPAYFTT
jgi:hypothetical protein